MPVNNKIKATFCWVFVCYLQTCLSISQVNIRSLSMCTHMLFLPAIIGCMNPSPLGHVKSFAYVLASHQLFYLGHCPVLNVFISWTVSPNMQVRLVLSVTFNILAKQMLVFQLSLLPVECSVHRFPWLHCGRTLKHLHVNARTLWGNGGIASCILKLGTRYGWPASCPGHLPFGKVLFVPSE